MEEVNIKTQRFEKSEDVIEKLSKIVSYPIFGNAPASFQSWIERRAGERFFNALDASRTSCWTNIALYSAVAGLVKYLSQETYFDPIMFDHISVSLGTGLFLGVAGGVLEREARHRIGLPCASLPGKILSAPFEFGKFIYDKLRN